MVSNGDIWGQVAEQICTAHQISEGDKVSISMNGPSALSLARAVVSACYSRGALPQVLAPFESYESLALVQAPDEVLSTPNPMEVFAMEWSDVHVSLRPMEPPAPNSIDPQRLTLLREAKGIVSSLRWRCRSWVIVKIPSPEWAEMIGLPYERLLNDFMGGVGLDWGQHQERIMQLCDWLNSTKTIRIVTPEGTLKMKYESRIWIPFAGKQNLPDGEVATAPLVEEVEGTIFFPGRMWFGGQLVEDLELGFEDGKASVLRAKEGKEAVESLIAMDEGASFVGELGIGTNPGVQNMSGDLFFDEKILGSVHLALGRAYPECGGTNDSSLHWDIVRDLRHPGCHMYIDDVALVADGKVVGPLAALLDSPMASG